MKITNILMIMVALCLSVTKLFAEEGWKKAKEGEGVLSLPESLKGRKSIHGFKGWN